MVNPNSGIDQPVNAMNRETLAPSNATLVIFVVDFCNQYESLVAPADAQRMLTLAG